MLHVVCACPGSGKTRKLVNEIKRLLDTGVHPESIMALTFTRHAAHEMKLRVGTDVQKLVSFGTFHSVARSLLQSSGCLTREPFHVDEFQFHLHDVLEDLTSRKQDDHPLIQVLKQIKFLFVDEFQDVNEIQYKLICLISRSFVPKTWVVGDENQNIFRFRGSDSKYLANCTKDFSSWAQVSQDDLDINHRSTQPIVDILNFIAQYIAGLARLETKSTLRPETKSGRRDKDAPKPCLVYYMNYQRANQDIANRIQKLLHKGTPPGSICVLTRTSHPLHDLAKTLTSREIDCEIWAQSAQSSESLSSKGGSKVILSTIHSAKGQGIEHVFIQLHNLFFPDPRSDLIDEWKLWYVAVSRCATYLIVYDHYQHRSDFVAPMDSSLFDIDKDSLQSFAHMASSLRMVKSAKSIIKTFPTSWAQVATRLDGGMFRFLKQRFLGNLESLTSFEKRGTLQDIFPEAAIFSFYMAWFDFHRRNEVPLEPLLRCVRKEGVRARLDKLQEIHSHFENMRHLYPFTDDKILQVSTYLDKISLQTQVCKQTFQFETIDFCSNAMLDDLLCVAKTSPGARFALVPSMDVTLEFKITLSDLIRAIYLALLVNKKRTTTEEPITSILLFHLDSLTVSELPLQDWDIDRQAEFLTFFNQFFL